MRKIQGPFEQQIPGNDPHGRWGAVAVYERYREYCCQFAVVQPLELSLKHYTKEEYSRLTTPVDAIIERIPLGDAAAAHIGVDLLCEFPLFFAGKCAKARTANLLRRTELSEELKERLRIGIVGMFRRAYLPQEFRDLLKLLRRIGLGEHRAEVERWLDSWDRYHRACAEYLLYGHPKSKYLTPRHGPHRYSKGFQQRRRTKELE